MNRTHKINRIYIPLMCVITALSVALRITAVLLDFDVRTGYFDSKGLVNAASIIVTAGSFLLFTYAFVGAKQEKLIATFTTPSTYIPSGAIVAALLFFAVKSYERIRDFDLLPEYARGFQNITKYVSQNLPQFVTAVLVPLSLLAAVYFILNATVDKRASEARAGFGICTVILFALYASFLYFDTTLAINAPNKIVDQMAFIFAALFFLYEIRISLGRECWHLYMAFGFIAATLCAYSSIPSLVLYCTDESVISHSIQENVLTLCIFIFILSRVILAGKLNADKESEFVAAMRDSARERNKYITEKEEVERAAYLELYNRLKEIEEITEEVNESELFGTVKETDSSAPDDEEADGTAEAAEPAEETAPSDEATDKVDIDEESTESEEEASPEEATNDKAPEEESAGSALPEEDADSEALPKEDAAADSGTEDDKTDKSNSASDSVPDLIEIENDEKNSTQEDENN